LPSLQGWLKVCQGVELANCAFLRRSPQWGEVLHKYAANQSDELRPQAWRVCLDLSLRLVEIGAAGPDIMRGINMRATANHGQPHEKGQDEVAVPEAQYSDDQLRSLFRLLLQEPVQIGTIMIMALLQAGGWHTEASLDGAMRAELLAVQQSKDPEVKFPDTMAVPSLDQWPQESRNLILRRMAQLKKPATEVAGDVPPHDYLQVLARLPFAEVAEELTTRCNNSNAKARQAVMQCMVECASRDDSAESGALSKVMECLERRLRNEQDDVRSYIIQRLSSTIPLRMWGASHVAACKQILTFSLQAKGTSSMSLRAWNSFAQHLVTSGLASVVPSAGGQMGSLGPVGDFGLEAVDLLKGAKQFHSEDPDFGASVLRQLDALAKTSSWKPDVAIMEWAVQRWLAPKVQTFVQKRDAESGCSLCARWEGLRQLLACEPSPKLSSLLEATFQMARSNLSALMPPESLFSSALMLWPTEATGNRRGGRRVVPRRGLRGRGFRMRNSAEDLPKPASGPILETQREALRLLADGLSKQSLLNFFAQVAARALSDTEVPRNVVLAVEFLSHPQGKSLERSDPALFSTLVQAVCTSWGRLTEEQRPGAASLFTNRAGRLKPLITLIADWQFPMDGPLKASNREQSQALSVLSAKMDQRSKAQTMLLPASKVQRCEAKRSMLARWKELPTDSQAELLASSPNMCWYAQRKDPEILWLLLPGGRSTPKLHMLLQLVQECHLPLHLLKAEPGLVSAKPLLHWPRPLQEAFAEHWLLPSLTQDFVRAATGWRGSLLQVQASALCLQLPHVDVGPVRALVAYCTEVLKGKGDSSAEMALRGSAGTLLDQMMLLLPKADQASAIADIVADQVGMGTSKQAVRSLKKLLLRLSPREAASLLQTLLSKERLKVAERVAMVRMLGDFLGRTAVPVLEGVWNNGTCHRDVGGAVLVQLRDPRVCCDRSMELFATACQSAVHDEKVLYPLQVVLQNLQRSPPTGAEESKIIGTLAKICSEANCPAGVCGLAINALQAWVLELCASATPTASLPAVGPLPGSVKIPPGQQTFFIIPAGPPPMPSDAPPMPSGAPPMPSGAPQGPQVSQDRLALAKEVAEAAASLFVDLVGRGKSARTWMPASDVLIRLSMFVLDPLADSIRTLLAHTDTSPGSQASARLAALVVRPDWELGACGPCASILMEPRETAPAGPPASAKWGLQLWARSLLWALQGQPVFALKHLPSVITAEPAFLPALAAAVSGSFSSPVNAAAMAKGSQQLPNLQYAAEALLELKDSVGSAAIAMLISVARYAAEALGMGWSGWRSEAMRGAHSYPRAPMALQLLLLEVQTEEAAEVEEAAPMVQDMDDESDEA